MQTTDWTAQAIEPGPHPSRLDTLIHALCPDGVEYVKLWSVTTWSGRFQGIDKSKQPEIISYPKVTAAELQGLEQPEGDVFLLSTGEYTGWTTEEVAEEYLSQGEVVTIPSGKSRPVAEIMKYYNGKFVNSGNHLATSNDPEKLSTKFLYYWMSSQGRIIDKFYRGAGIQHPEMQCILNLSIPLPPLEVQEEIVRILDKFSETTTALVDNLQAEYEGRKKQYAYYRDKLLTFPPKGEGTPNPNPTTKLDRLLADLCPDGVEYVKIKDICKNITSGGTPTRGRAEYYDGTIPWLRTQEVDWCNVYDTAIKITEKGLNSSSAKWIPENCVIIAMYGATAAKACINKIPLTTNQACCNLEIDETKALYKYVYYFFSKEYLTLKSKGQGSQSNINSKTIKEMSLPLPPLEVQEEIVRILDKFDTLTHDLTEGLPAEIEAREKQYTYYRDKLLTFPKKTA